ncbi:MAG: IS30 family transposase, partial [Coriobacteriaceae bacterium]
MLRVSVFFCLPHHPWERGTNENTDGFFRDWLPKDKSLDDAIGAEVQKAYNSLNRGLCKRL